MDEPTGWPTDNPPNSDGLGVYHQTVPDSTVRVYRQPGLRISQQLGLDLDPDPKWRSGTVGNTTGHPVWAHRWARF